MEKLKAKKSWKDKLKHEFIEYWINVIYLAIFFSVFILYRRLILAHYEVYLDDYFMGAIKALVFAKVIMIGSFLRIGKGFENKPLIIPIVYKSFMFTIFLAIFDIVEVYIRELIRLESFSVAADELANHFNNIWLGGVLVVFICFIPFFAMKELSRALGPEKIQNLFFKKREA